MVWVHGDDYMWRRKAELKHLLLLRHLPYSGRKKEMVSRLLFHDEHHPFPFEKLPAELRNKIYKLVVSAQGPSISGGLGLQIKGHTEGPFCFVDLVKVMAHSALFRVNKQTRTEGLALFYRHHRFRLSVQHGGCFLAIIQWLRNIGDIGRQNIRHLVIRFRNNCLTQDRVLMNRIHALLSDQATVTYIAENARGLWRIGRRYQSINPAKVPYFMIESVDSEPNPQTADLYADFTTNVDWKEYLDDDSLQYSLLFLPGVSWFG